MTKYILTFAVAALIFAGCSSDDDATPDTEPPATVAPTTTAPPTATTAPPTSAPPTTAPPTTAPPTTTTTSPPAEPGSKFLDIVAGVSHTCLLYNSGKVSCWGENENGQLGNGQAGQGNYSSIPIEVSGITDAVDLAAGWEHTCAVHATGEISCWGDDSQGELGNGEMVDFESTTVKVVGIDNAVEVTAGHWHTCALRSTGSISCWGNNHDGQLGNGELDSARSSVPVDVVDISDAIAVSAGGEHTCAVHATGEVSCWGDNARGELGNGQDGNEFDSAIPVKVLQLNDAVSISSGDWHTCAVRENGKIACWGYNIYGELGNNESTFGSVNAVLANTPVEVSMLDDATNVSAGSAFTCAVRESGQISCWGLNIDGQLGTPDSQGFAFAPSAVTGISDATRVASGTSHACALREADRVSCWGGNFYGQLGNGENSNISPAHVRVAGISDAINVSASTNHTCATHATGEISCWGQNWSGQSFDGEEVIFDPEPLPLKIPQITNATFVSADTGVTCATLEGGEASCWGFYLQNDVVTNSDGDILPVPVKWEDTADIIRAETGGSHACALHSDGTITCGGANWFGNVGTGEFGTSISWAPTKVVNINDATDISLGFAHTCALHSDGGVSCWGSNADGQLGNGDENFGNHQASPVRVEGITDAIAISASDLASTCALHATGEVSCWGINNYGILGTAADTSTDHSSVPVKIEGISDATAISVGAHHVCVLHEGGGVSCWGASFHGQLGSSEVVADDFSAVPVRIEGITDATAVTAGSFHSCVLHESGYITCWGWDQSGQLGDGQAFVNTSSFVPVDVILTFAVPASEPVDIATGVRHSCLLRESGSVLCWGDNENGQLGNGEFGSNVYSTIPVEVEDITDAVAIAAGWEHTCALHTTGEVSCWGDNSNGELGTGESGSEADSSPSPVKVEDIDDAVAVTAGHWHTCVLREGGSISCWGGDHDGQLGNGEIGDEFNSAVPVSVLNISDAIEVSAGGEHTCAVHTTGEVSCWGDNWRGELGTGEIGNAFDSAEPIKVPNINDAISVSSGDWHTCVLHENGGVSCWGANETAQLGAGINFFSFTSADPVSVTNISDATAVSAGSGHTCAVRENGNISCWGSNIYGQLGTPAAELFSAEPVTVQGVSDAKGLATGSAHTCALQENGEASCWGSNFHGQLGHAQDSGISYNKVRVAGIDNVIGVSAADRNTCVTHATGEVSCWGSNWRGAVAELPASNLSPTLPVMIEGITTAVRVSTDLGISCATLESGEASCWGFYLGNGVVTTEGGISPVPIKWEDTADITSIETGGSHACALHSDGTITCAGANWFGNLGTGEFGTSISWTPAKVVNIDDATDISLGFAHTCALHESGEVSCWGRNDNGQLGNGVDGLENNSPVPVKVQGITDAIAISASNASLTCVLHESGEVSCWGSNAAGELGAHEDIGGEYSSVDHSSVPVKIEGITDITAITAGGNHVCVLHESGEVSCWGSNGFGELGVGHIPDDYSASPVKVEGIADAKSISAGALHTCALRQSGSVTCWGWDEHGQLGDGQIFASTNSFVPVKVFGTSA